MHAPTPEQTNNPQLQALLGELGKLEAELVIENPQLHTYIERINNNLRAQPDLIHLISDEQAAPFYKAMMKVADVQLAPKKKAAKVKEEKAQIDINNLF